MIRFFGVWGVASVQGAADILTLVLAVPIAVRVMRDIEKRERKSAAALPSAF